MLRDQWEVFGYEDWQEWDFGITFKKSDTGDIWEFDFVAAVEYLDDEGNAIYEWIIKVPDQENEMGSIQVGDCFTPIYYDATQYDCVYNDLDSNAYDAPEFCIGAPYQSPNEYDDITDYITAVYMTCFNEDDPTCSTYDEMVQCFSFGT